MKLSVRYLPVLFALLATPAFDALALDYTFASSGSGSLMPMTSPTTVLGTGVDDQAGGPYNIGFTFTFGCTEYTQFSASSNGMIGLGGTQVTAAYWNGSFPDDITYPVIAAFYDDLTTGNNGYVRYSLEGSSPNRILVVEWRAALYPNFGATDYTIQARLYEGTSRIEYYYGGSNVGYSGTIGGALSASDFMSVDPSGPSLSTSTAYNNVGARAQGTLYTFDPAAADPVPDVATLPTITGECSATITTSPTATDGCTGATIVGTTGDPLSYSVQGSYTVTWTYDNPDGDDVTQTQTVIVDDVTAPAADQASLATVTGECSVTLTAPTATDNCSGTIVGTTTDPTSYSAQGTYTVTWTYDDGNGNTSTQTQTVIVDDVTNPELTVTLSPTVLWPPNHTMRTIAVSATATDNCIAGAIWVLTSVTGDDGTDATDISASTGSAVSSFSVRAERTGGGSGRTYTCVFTATDAAGNETQATVTVFVPHDQRSKPTIGEPVVSGGLTSSNAPNPFSTQTEIRYTLAEKSNVTVAVVDMLGQIVTTLVDAAQTTGEHVALWNGRDRDGNAVAAGTYIYRIDANGHTATGTMIVVR